MFPCPHCGNKIESDPQEKEPWHQQGDTQVTLGCGTLILIAIIVSIFSKSGDDSESIRRLQRDIQGLELKIDKLTKDVNKPR